MKHPAFQSNPHDFILIIQQEKQTTVNNNNIKLYCDDQKLFKSGTKKFMEE